MERGARTGRRLINEVDISRDTESKNDSDSLKFTTGQMLDFLVNKIIELEGLDDIRLELRRQESSLDLLEEQLANGTLELGSDGLGLHGDLHLRNPLSAIGLENTSQETAEGGLSGTVLTHHDDDFGIRERTSVDGQVEVAHGLLHSGVLESAGLVRKELLSAFGNAESQGLVTETQVLGRDVTVEENVDTFTDGVREGDDTVDGGLTVETADVIGKVIEDGQIVLDNDDVVVGAEEGANDAGGAQSLLDIEVRGRLVEHVDIGLLNADGTDSETLKFTT